MYQPDNPYNDLPPLPPGAELETREVMRKAISANRALARLTGSVLQLPNQSMLISTILLQEAKLSSEIENIVTTNDELYQALSTDLFAPNPLAKEVLYYNEALWKGYHFVREKGYISTNLIVELFRIFKESSEGIRTTTGTRIKTSKTGKTIYTPPEGETVIRNLLKNWEDYLHEDGPPDPLIRMAVLHYQFEAIHPFSDGNGRTGRILNLLYLVQQGLLQLPVLFLSKYIIEHKSGYYSGLLSVTEHGAWEPWILYMLEAVEQTAQYTQQKVDAICGLMKQTGEDIRTKHPELYSKELIEALFLMPYCRRKTLVDYLGISAKTAGVYLIKLEASGFLRSLRRGKEKLYLNQRLFALLRTDN